MGVSLVPCPTFVPGLSHAFSGTQKLLKRGHLTLFFSLVPQILQQKRIFVSVCGVIGVICVQEYALCITKHVQTTLIQLCFRHTFNQQRTTDNEQFNFQKAPTNNEPNDPRATRLAQIGHGSNIKVRETRNFPLLA